MKRFAVLFVLLALLAVPVAVSAQYGNDYPMGGNSGGGGGMSGGGSSGGSITVGGGSSGGNMGGNMGGDEGGAKDVDIVDFSFQPAMVFVHPGDTVEWYNEGGAPHTVTSDSGAFDSGVISPGGEYSQTFGTPGTYKYHCDIHENMHGTVLVLGQ